MIRQVETFTVTSPEQLKAISDPLRQRLMGAFGEPATIKAAAERLGVPLGRLYHHVDLLEAAGLIRVVSERKRRAAIERTFQATARRVQIAASAMEGPKGEESAGAASAMARAAVEQLLSSLYYDEPGQAALHMVQTTLRLTPQALADLEMALGAFLQSFESPDGVETPLVWMAAARAAATD